MIGQLWIAATSEEMRILDFTLLPENQENGLRSRLIRGVLEEAAAADLPARVCVMKEKRGEESFLASLGFQRAQVMELYYLMEWTPRGRKVPADGALCGSSNQATTSPRGPGR